MRIGGRDDLSGPNPHESRVALVRYTFVKTGVQVL